jgi:tetratricopeptide (TPR) repeat protein
MFQIKKNHVVIIFCGLLLFACDSKSDSKNKIEEKTLSVKDIDSITSSVLLKTHGLSINSEARRAVLDSAIIEFPDIAYFYQQRAMPLYKEDKDKLGLPFLEKAAELKPEKYMDYMAFMKCIFSKNYRDAILDFNSALTLNGEDYVMDHSYYFYLGLCHLQLNEFVSAKDYFEKSIAQSVSEGGEKWIHFTDLMYLGIANYELEQYSEAIEIFNKSLQLQPKFSEVQYYKSKCLIALGDFENAKNIYIQAKQDFLNGDIMFEDNTVYERYPYQVRKSWFGL